jgi:hypothetical protein
VVQRWAEQGVNAVAIHAALSREHGYRGSYSSVYRMVMAIGARRPPEATVPLYFPPVQRHLVSRVKAITQIYAPSGQDLIQFICVFSTFSRSLSL